MARRLQSSATAALTNAARSEPAVYAPNACVCSYKGLANHPTPELAPLSLCDCANSIRKRGSPVLLA